MPTTVAESERALNERIATIFDEVANLLDEGIEGLDRPAGIGAALAHRVGRTHDWVVLSGDGREGEIQATGVTAVKGQLSGRRVVRGRERECIAHHHLSSAA